VEKGFRAASLDGEGFGTSDAKPVLKQKKGDLAALGGSCEVFKLPITLE